MFCRWPRRPCSKRACRSCFEMKNSDTNGSRVPSPASSVENVPVAAAVSARSRTKTVYCKHSARRRRRNVWTCYKILLTTRGESTVATCRGRVITSRYWTRTGLVSRRYIESTELKPIETFHYSLGENSCGSRERCPMGNHG